MPEVKAIVKLQAPAGKATPAPPVGTALGPHGINLQQFVTQFNDLTKEMMGDIIPAEITIFQDRTFAIKLKTPPAPQLLMKAAKIDKGSATPQTNKVGTVTRAQIRDIAERKMVDLSARDLASAEKIIEGTARSMGITIKE
jgi:large subunit ribosomal protein L11